MNSFVNCLCPGYIFDVKDENPSFLHLISRLYGCITFYDRFFELNDTYEFSLSDTKKTDISLLEKEKYISFEDCCSQRSEEIIQLSKKYNKNIYILYSGGVDSTCVLVSFLKSSSLEKRNLYVLFNEYSIKEYPLFFTRLKNLGLNLIDFGMDSTKIDEYSKNDILVSGMCGDQLDGSNLCTTFKFPFNEFDSWETCLGSLYMYEKKINELPRYEEYREIVKNYSKRLLGKEIYSFKEFSWLFNFSCKWVYISDILNLSSIKHENRISFFDTLYFQKWCLTNINTHIKYTQNNPLEYKKDWKKYIFKYTKDSDYLLKKGKEGYYFSQAHFPNKFIINDSEKGYIIYDKEKNLVEDIINQYSKKDMKIMEYNL